MLSIGFRVRLDDFLDEVERVFLYHADDPEMDNFIYLWSLLSEKNFCETLVKVSNIELLYRDGEEDELTRDDKLYYLQDEIHFYNPKDGSLEYEIRVDTFSDFAYAFVHYISDWISEFADYGNILNAIEKKGDRLNVTIS